MHFQKKRVCLKHKNCSKGITGKSQFCVWVFERVTLTIIDSYIYCKYFLVRTIYKVTGVF